ncbi:uncharacterized protein EDB91DRAFT_1304313 [Suillus paluster]|uniref:uncharacterized protein n=1 Tax=Suillus paluster TaxID=48578 RepID=UPI001B87BE96|nr:uncharacterized protein EDB91DRAFT_1304313 [Suillus paluster]KAG1750559.1 hypothetical protein EDB91DRAFT_1304313 [Suillus paluster]
MEVGVEDMLSECHRFADVHSVDIWKVDFNFVKKDIYLFITLGARDGIKSGKELRGWTPISEVFTDPFDPECLDVKPPADHHTQSYVVDGMMSESDTYDLYAVLNRAEIWGAIFAKGNQEVKKMLVHLGYPGPHPSVEHAEATPDEPTTSERRGLSSLHVEASIPLQSKFCVWEAIQFHQSVFIKPPNFHPNLVSLAPRNTTPAISYQLADPNAVGEPIPRLSHHGRNTPSQENLYSPTIPPALSVVTLS